MGGIAGSTPLSAFGWASSSSGAGISGRPTRRARPTAAARAAALGPAWSLPSGLRPIGEPASTDTGQTPVQSPARHRALPGPGRTGDEPDPALLHAHGAAPGCSPTAMPCARSLQLDVRSTSSPGRPPVLAVAQGRQRNTRTLPGRLGLRCSDAW